MSDVSNSFSAWETLPEEEPPLCIADRVTSHVQERIDAVKIAQQIATFNGYIADVPRRPAVANALEWTLKYFPSKACFSMAHQAPHTSDRRLLWRFRPTKTPL
ncbi:hypothetical protein RB195_024612 [Necator americanus]|uniref:Uncharacterized protein n=1 Tax=Necator americanus TaxID=51031 RepID=A0ABR1EP04_NECAM